MLRGRKRPVRRKVVARGLAAALAAVVLGAGCQSATVETPTSYGEPSASPTPWSSVTATALPSAEATASGADINGDIVQVLVEGLRMRAEPSTDAEVVATLSAGQQAWATGESHIVDEIQWLEVHQEPSGRTGWVAAIGPDGSSWLAVVRDGPLAMTAGQDAELVDPSTGDRSPLTSGMYVTDLAFAPDGQHVALIDANAGPQVAATDALFTLDPPPVRDGQFAPTVRTHAAFAPNGDALAFLEGRGLQLIWLGEGQAPTFALPSTRYPISWSPDSRRIAGADWVNAETGETEDWDIAVAVEGQPQASRLTNGSGGDLSPAWSPDGSAISFLHDDARDSIVGLALMNADGSDQRTLRRFDGDSPAADGFSAAAPPAWSPDGTRIAIALDGYPAMIHVVDAHTSEYLTISISSGPQCHDLTWSPTGTRIAFVCGLPEGFGETFAYVATVGEPNVTDLGPASRIDWARALEPLHHE